MMLERGLKNADGLSEACRKAENCEAAPMFKCCTKSLNESKGGKSGEKGTSEKMVAQMVKSKAQEKLKILCSILP